MGDKMSSEFKHILYEKRNGVAWITLNNPDRYNALVHAMRIELKVALSDAGEDEKVRVVVIKGSGEAFSAGGDIRAFIDWKPIDVLKTYREVGTSFVLARMIREMPKPVIAAVHGYCLGAGFELAQACDIIVASEDAIFGQPEVNVGVIPGGGGTQRLPRLIGEKKAKELIFTGERVPAKELAKLGIINKVVPRDKLIETVNEFIDKIKNKSPIILGAAKEAVNASMEFNLSEGLRYEALLFAQLFSTEDQKEGAKAFLEKRKPEWKGK